MYMYTYIYVYMYIYIYYHAEFGTAMSPTNKRERPISSNLGRLPKLRTVLVRRNPT